MADQFVGKKTLQPKKEIMTNLASKGIPVPRIYSSLDDAIKKMDKRRILLRSEHPQDYEGSSDLFPSGMLEQGLLKTGNPTEELLRTRSQQAYDFQNQIELHCQMLGLNHPEFISELTHSAWDYLIGDNYVISADSAIKDKYHLILVGGGRYSIIERDQMISITDFNGFEQVTPRVRELIELYESIRDNLDSTHCYIVETLTVRDTKKGFKHFAVQVHRGVDFFPVDFKAQPTAYPYIELDKIRGATKSSEGENVTITLKYPKYFNHKPTPIKEDGSVEASTHYVPRAFSEAMFRRRKLQIVPFRDDDFLRQELANHCSRNALLKPSCSALTYSSNFWRHLDRHRFEGLSQITANFVSDGTNAYLCLLDE